MSCLHLIEKYEEEHSERKRGSIFNEVVTCLEAQEEKRTKDLYDFIDDFIKSEEYLQYIKAKKKITKQTVSTQCAENDIIVELRQKDLVDRYPLTEERKKIFAFKEQFEKYTERKNQLKEYEKQKKGIEIIKKKIDDAKQFFECTRVIIQKNREKNDERILRQYSEKLDKNLMNLSSKTRFKILKRVKNYQRLEATRREKRRQNVFRITEKLLFEYRVQKEEKKRQKKSYDYKVKRKEKIIKDMEVVGKKLELIDRNKVVDVQPEEPKAEEEVPLEVEVHEGKKKKGKDKKEIKDKKEKKEKKPKGDKPKKEKKEKGKKKEKQEAKFELPHVPITNAREKITSDNVDRMFDIVEEFRDLDSKLENRCMSDDVNKNLIVTEKGLLFKPKTILFQNYEEERTYKKTIKVSNISTNIKKNYEEERTYKKTIKVSNISTNIKKVRFLKYSFQNPYDEVVFKVEDFGIQKLYTGCFAKFSVSFQPYDSSKSYEGKMAFLSYDTRNCQYYIFELDIKCLPKYSDLQIYPSMVSFGRMPIWRAQSTQYVKTIKLNNRGAMPCTIFIHKIHDPLDLETLLDEEENKENIPPVPQNSETTLLEEYECIQNILNFCIENLDNCFCFENSFLDLNGFEERKINIFFKNSDYIGNYSEKFTVDVYEQHLGEDKEIVGCQEISVRAETIGHFISVQPEILDFGVCQINSWYQLCFEIYNSTNKTQTVSVRFPSAISFMFHTDTATCYITGQGKREVWIRLFPRYYAYKGSCTYFDKNTSILEFPIHLYVVSKDYEDYPPLTIQVYAIFTNTEDLSIMASPKYDLTNFLDTILLDMKACSIYETVWTEMFLINNTGATQYCGFIDLPEGVVIEPNYGFLRLDANQRKKIKVLLNPKIQDFPTYSFGNLKNNKYFFKLKVDTVSNLGQIRMDGRQAPSKRLKSSAEIMIKELTRKNTPEDSMFGFVADMKKELKEQSYSTIDKNRLNNSFGDSNFGQRTTTGDLYNTFYGIESHMFNDETVNRSFEDTILGYQNFVILETNSRKEVWCKVTLERPLLEFSHQTIEFPDTPCGSYSMMEIKLTALEREMDYTCEISGGKKKKNKLNFKAHFRITGDNPEISVEPNCGALRTEESIKITLLAKPNVPQEIVNQTAKTIKYSEIYEMKLKEFQDQIAKKHSKKGKEKEPKGKKGKEKDKKPKKQKESEKTKNDSKGKKSEDKNVKEETVANIEEIPNITVTDKELEYEYDDLFPAEMVYWRDMQPYYIHAKFTCYIDYESDSKNRRKKPEMLYLDAVCKVIRPDFTSSLKLQRLDFEKCIIGMTMTKEIMLKNIKYDDIKIETTLLNPVGGFAVPHIKNFVVPPEHSLRLTINYSPVSMNKTTEYFEIKSEATVLPLILCGEGVQPIIKITPEFSVFRLDTKPNRLAELQLKIENASEAQANIHLEKLFEIETRLEDINKLKTEVKEEAAAAVPKDKKQKAKKETKKTHDKVPKFSENLTDRELDAIEKCFKPVKDKSHFDFVNTDTEKYVTIQPGTSHSLVIFFGTPELLEKRKTDKGKKAPKEKGKTAKKEKTEETSSKKDEENKKTGVGGKQYITQYNVFVGTTYLKSIVLICTSQ